MGWLLRGKQKKWSVERIRKRFDAAAYRFAELEEGQEDWLTAVAFDWWGLYSEAAEDYVRYS